MSNPSGVGLDGDYHNPISTPDTGRPGWLPSSPLGDSLFGKGYVNESDPSWEEVITMVVIPGDPSAIYRAAGAWEVLFSRIGQAKAMIDQVVQSVQGWQGAAGETYREHLIGLSQGLTELMEQHRPVVQHLRAAADNLQHALERTPIPDDMIDQVNAARAAFHEGGRINASSFGPGAIYDFLFPIFSNRWLDDIGNFLTFGFWDWATDKMRDWISNEDDKAKAAYRQLAGQHVSTMDTMPQGYQFANLDTSARTVTPGLPGGPANPSTVNRPTGFGDPTGPTTIADPPLGDGTTLAGAGGGPLIGVGGGGGPGGLTPVGGGVGGLGGGLGGAGGGGLSGAALPGSSSAASVGRGGAGMTGAGAAGRGAGGAGAGRAGRGIGGGMPGGGMAGAGAGAAGRGAGAGAGKGAAGGARGAGAAGRGTGGRVAGGAPMGAGHGGGSEGGADHSTWLNEDEDVWGADSDAPPPVLGG